MTIATGERWHELASILAARTGKDVYSEKPCGLSIAEGVMKLTEEYPKSRDCFSTSTQPPLISSSRSARTLGIKEFAASV